MKKLLAILLLATTSLFAQSIIWEEEFTGDSLNHPNSIEEDPNTTLNYMTDHAKGNPGCCIGDTKYYSEHGISYDSLSYGGLDMEVRGYMWKTGSTGTNTCMIGFWGSIDEYIGFGVDNVYFNEFLKIISWEGGADPYDFPYYEDLDGSYDGQDSTLYYRVHYTSSDTTTRFYIQDGAGWDTLGTYAHQLPNQMRVGWRAGIFNATSSGSLYGDSLWAQFVPAGNSAANIEMEYPDDADLFFREDSVITIEWDIGTGAATWQRIQYSIDGGATYTLIDTIDNGTDSTYSWTIPDESSSNCYVKIDDSETMEDSSANSFTILTSSSIDIIYPIEKEGVTIQAGDTLHINIESQFVNNLWLYWSKDSTNWAFVDSMAVDTVNGQFLDTTNYVWTFDGTVSGPEVWVKAEEQADTNLYVFEENYISLGRGYPYGAPFVCQTQNQIGFIEQLVHYDPSCGWSNPTKSWHLGALNDLAESRSWTFNECDWPYDDPSCTYPRLAHTWQITAPDTIEMAPDVFYGAPAATVTYQGRLYYISNDTLWNNDLINSINGIFVSDLTGLYGSGGWTAGDELIQVYHVQYSKIISDTTNSTDDYESLNDSWFNPKILIGVDTYPQSTVSMNALGYPANADPADDTQKILTGSSFNRYFFRGIHPKIDKDR